MSIEDHTLADLKSQLDDDGVRRACVWMPVFGRMGWDRWGTKRLLERLASPAFVDELVKAGFGGGSRESFAVYVEHMRRNLAQVHW